jgi:ketosteroid isomerase-like protein
MAAHGLVISDVLAAWASGDFEAFAQALAPDVELLGHDPSSQSCRNRQEVLTLLRQRHARGRTPGVIRIDDIGEGALVVSGLYGGESARPAEAASAALVTFRDGKISRLRQYRTRQAALTAAGACA